MLAVLGPWSIGLFLLGSSREFGGSPSAGEELRAAVSMELAMLALCQEMAERGLAIDKAIDPNGSGLVGLPFSGITTTLGSLGAKRTGAQPDAAALMVRLLRDAGIRRGSIVAVDSSGSFPGFAIATLVASKEIGAEAVLITSIGSSTYGANRPEFTMADIVEALVARGVIPHSAAAISAGGGGDVGIGMDGEETAQALARARRYGALVLEERELSRNVAARRAVFERKGSPAVLVSIGGNWSAVGSGEAFAGRNGLLRPEDFSDEVPLGAGLIQDFLRSGIPVIRVLDVKDLCAKTGLAFDPTPWPERGRAALYRSVSANRIAILSGPLIAIAVAVVIRRQNEKKATRLASARGETANAKT